MLQDESLVAQFPILRDLVEGKQARIRLGKFMGKAGLKLEPSTKIVTRDGAFVTHTLLNWRDLAIDPFACDVVATALPTRLLNHASFNKNTYFETHFGEEKICLPAEMRFLARLPGAEG
jgi:hypothetical protein